MNFSPGQRYGSLEIQDELGRGAFGTVFRARDALIGRSVALKVIRGNQGEAESRQQVLTEARLIGGLQSPHVVTLFRLHTLEDGGLLQEMELVKGGSLLDRLGAQGNLPLGEACRVFRGICLALEAAHAARVVHGDVKPANVLFSAKGVPKLADFGLARLLEGEAESVSLHGSVEGSPLYMSPESLSGTETGMASDVWSAAVVLYECLTGRLPFPAVTYPELLVKVLEEDPDPPGDQVPAGIQALLSRGLAREPADRPSVKEVLAELDRLAEQDSRLAGDDSVRQRPTNLMSPPSAFIGRERELSELAELLEQEESRLVTVLGPGGIGKTRLAQEACARLLARFTGGAWFADLSETTESAGIARVVAEALGINVGAEKDPVEAVAGVLRFRPPLLLVLDNFEQILDHVQTTLAKWLSEAPDCRFLVTSRAPLGLPEERSWELNPLSMGRDGEAVQLFVERAREAASDYEPDRRDRAAILGIVSELDGMPLAIELAAARTRIMKPELIARNLSKKFQLLKSTRRDVTARQKTLRGAIDWSYDLLEEWERDAFLQASLFRDGFSPDAAESVLDLSGFPDAPAVLEALRSLREKSLLTAMDAGQQTRLSMYRAIKEYGGQRSSEDRETVWRDRLARRHTRYFTDYAEEWNARIPGYRDQEAFERIGREMGNLQVVRLGAADRGDAATLVRVALAVAETLQIRWPPVRYAEWIEEALERATGKDERVRLLTHLSVASRLGGDWDRAIAAGEKAVADGAGVPAHARALVEHAEILRNRGSLDGAREAFERGALVAEDAGDRAALAAAIGGRGMVLGRQGDFDAAFRCFCEAYSLARSIGDGYTAAVHTGNRGVVYEVRGEHEAALKCHREAEELSRRSGNRLRVAVALGAQANVLAQRGDHEESLRCYREAEDIARQLGAKQRIAQIVGNRGGMLQMIGRLEEAEACFREAESLAIELGDRRRVALSMGQRALILSRRGRHEEAIEVGRQVETLCRELGDRSLEARSLCNRASFHIGLDQFEDAWDAMRRGVGMFDEMGANRSLWYFTFKSSLARLAKIRGDHETAMRLVRANLDLAEQLEITDEHPDESVRDSFEELRKLSERLS